jgi:hypothetical protein
VPCSTHGRPTKIPKITLQVLQLPALFSDATFGSPLESARNLRKRTECGIGSMDGMVSFTNHPVLLSTGAKLMSIT